MVNDCFQVSTFFIEAVDLGDVEKLVVEKSPGPQWHLSQITVKKGPFAPSEDVFQYDRCIIVYSSLILKSFQKLGFSNMWSRDNFKEYLVTDSVGYWSVSVFVKSI